MIDIMVLVNECYLKLFCVEGLFLVDWVYFFVYVVMVMCFIIVDVVCVLYVE